MVGRILKKFNIHFFILVSSPISCFICDSKEDEHCPETWTRKDILAAECGGPDGVQDARFCIKTIAVFGGLICIFFSRRSFSTNQSFLAKG